MLYAVLDGGQIVSDRLIENWEAYPAHKRAARDEKGDGGPTLRPIVGEKPAHDSELEVITGPVYRIELDRVVREWTITPRPLADVAAELLARVDADAEAVRLRVLTPGVGMMMTYQEKFAQAQAVFSMGEAEAGRLSEADALAQFPTLAASVGIEAPTLWACALAVLSRYTAFANLSHGIERARLAAKKAIKGAASPADARAAYQAVRWPNP